MEIGRAFSKIGRAFLMYLPENNFGTWQHVRNVARTKAHRQEREMNNMWQIAEPSCELAKSCSVVV
jgi:hypothetical protein